MIRADNNIIRHALDRLKGLVFRPRGGQPCAPTRRTAPSGLDFHSLPVRKKQKLQALCQDLARNRKFLSSGKIQFLNFKKVRDYLGSRWAATRQIIYRIADEVIGRHIDPGDVFFLYNEEEYIIIFARSDIEESNLKCALIASEIRRLLCDEAETHEALRHIEIGHRVTPISTADLASADNLPETMDIYFRRVANTPEKNPFFIDAPMARKNYISEKTVENHPEFLYMPMLDTLGNSINGYICTVRKDKNSAACHLNYLGLAPDDALRHKSRCDRLALTQTVHLLHTDALAADKPPPVCPVHFETLNADDCMEQYLRLFRAIEKPVAERLSLLVLNVPGNVPLPTLSNVTAPLRKNCRAITALVPFSPHCGFSTFVNAGLSGIGIRLAGFTLREEVAYGQHMQDFVRKLKLYGLKSTLFLDKKSDYLMKAAHEARFDCLSGRALFRLLREDEL